MVRIIAFALILGGLWAASQYLGGSAPALIPTGAAGVRFVSNEQVMTFNGNTYTLVWHGGENPRFLSRGEFETEGNRAFLKAYSGEELIYSWEGPAGRRTLKPVHIPPGVGKKDGLWPVDPEALVEDETI